MQRGPQRLGERVHRLGAVQGDDGDGVLAFDEQHGVLRSAGMSEAPGALSQVARARVKLAKPRAAPERPEDPTMTEIVDITAREILDSRGNPTVEVDVILEDGSMGRAAVPSGASTGAHEAVELRDGDKKRYGGKGVLQAVDAVNGEIYDALSGVDAEDQRRHRPAADRARRHAEQGAAWAPTPSWASAWPRPRPRPSSAALPLYSYVGGVSARVLPVPMMNIINGGAHADNPIDIQEFMILPTGAATFAEALRMGAEIFHALKSAAEGRRPQHQRRRRGRLRPQPRLGRGGAGLHRQGGRERPATRPATDFRAGPRRGRHRVLQGRQVRAWKGEGKTLDPAGMVDYLAGLVAKFPIVSIEDGCAEDDLEGWKLLTDRLGGKIQLVGDDLFVTNPERLAMGIGKGLANSILVKVNQIGTLTRDPGRRRYGPPRRLHRGDEPPLGRDRGLDHRRPRRRHQLRADQDRLAGPLRPDGQVQPAPAHRGRAGRPGGLRRPRGAQGVLSGRSTPQTPA